MGPPFVEAGKAAVGMDRGRGGEGMEETGAFLGGEGQGWNT